MYVRPVVPAILLAVLVVFAAQAAAEQTRAPAQRTKQAFKVETFGRRGSLPPGAWPSCPTDAARHRTARPRAHRQQGGDGLVPLGGVPAVAVVGQGGLLDVALTPTSPNT